MQMASSAKRTCSECRSASEYTATVRMPSSLQAQITRSAISPRLAIKTFRNIFSWTYSTSFFEGARLQPCHRSQKYRGLSAPEDRSYSSFSVRTHRKELLAVFHGLAALDKTFHNLARCIGFDLVHQLHRLDDAEHLPLLHLITHLHKSRCAGRRRLIKSSHNRRFHN